MYTCGICVEEFPEDRVVKYCDGKHVFCKGCFDGWKEKSMFKKDKYWHFTNVTEHYCHNDTEYYCHGCNHDPYAGIIPDLICKDVPCPLCRKMIVLISKEKIASFSGTISKSLTRDPIGDNECGVVILNHIRNGFRPPTVKVTYTVECSYLNGKKHGLFKRVGYFSDTVEECRFENGRIQGNYTITVNNQVTVEAPYVDGKIHGVLRKWYYNENGSGEKRLRAHTNYQMGKREGEDRSYYEDGTNESSAIAENDLNIHLTLWWRNGNLRAIIDYRNQPIFTYRTWYKNGNPQEVITTKDWRRYGIYQKYDSSGNLVLEHDYGKGNLVGPEEQLNIYPEIDGDDEERALGVW